MTTPLAARAPPARTSELKSPVTNEHEEEKQGPIIRDRRRIDPDTYQVREPQETAAPAGTENVEANQAQAPDESATEAEPVEAEAETPDETAELQTALADRTSDLQRLQAEYINYKRRVDRDREVIKTSAVESVLKELLPVLDDLGSAKEHGELTGGFKAVAEQIQAVATRHGLEKYGTKGDPFDPYIHEALMHAQAEGITGPTCVEILQPGYRIGEKVLRPARVAVAEPSDPPTDVVSPETAAEPVVDLDAAPEGEQ